MRTWSPSFSDGSRRSLCAGIALALGCGLLQAAELNLQPVSITLLPGETSASVWITNTGASELALVSSPFAWQQHDGDEQLSPTPEVAVSPIAVHVPPGGRQRLRVVLRSAVPSGQERSYRIIIDELVQADHVARARYSLPMFVNVDQDAPLHLKAHLSSLGPSGTQLRIDNLGARHAKLVGLAYRPPDGEPRVLAADLAGYVLPGSYKHWSLPGAISAYREGSFEATVDGQPMRIPAATEAPAGPEPRP